MSGQPVSAPGSSLNAVAAISRASAWAVGTTSDQSFPANSTLTERWDGVRWTVVSSPNPGGSGRDAVSVLNGVAPVSPASAWAVGYYGTNAAVLSTKHALILRWNGAAWTQVAIPRLPDSVLNGITAISPADVWAVGYVGHHTLIEHWNGKRWARAASPSPFDSALNAVAATSRTNVWAVGHTGRGTLTERWNGVKWKQVASPSPHRRLGTDLMAVTAISRSSAWAAGRYHNPGETGLTEHWTGTTWRQVPSQGTIVRGLAAAPGGSAWAVGSAGRLALIEHRVGAKWTTMRSPVPSGAAKVQLHAVAMISARSGWAAGDYVSGNNSSALIERLDGTRWQRAAAPSPAGPAWGTPGTVLAFSGAGEVEVDSVSCTSPGNCGAAGDVSDAEDGILSPFVVSQVNGTWGAAIDVPGLAALDVDNFSLINSLSCASAGNCSAGGYYTPSDNGFSLTRQAFVVSEVNGTWGTAIEVPGTAALNAGNFAQVLSVSCASPGNCSAGGQYADTHAPAAFVVSEVNGTWGTAIKVPGTTKGVGPASVDSVSCGSAGNCVAGGADGNGKAFVVSEVNGHWGKFLTLPGTLDMLTTEANSVSCPSAGNCSIAGFYTDKSEHEHVFVASEANGHWGAASELAGPTFPGGATGSISLSCGSAGNCGGGGYDAGLAVGTQTRAFLFSKSSGRWVAATPIPGLAPFHATGSGITSVSCGSAGNCSAGGFYDDKFDAPNPLVVDQVNGRWGTAKAFGLTPYAQVNSVSCGSAGKCSAGGFYNGLEQGSAFMVSRG